MGDSRDSPGFWEKLTADLPDPDDVFAYDTVKEVKVLDRRLGMIYYAVLMLVFFYIVIYVFMIKQQYLDKEKTTGWILTKVVNPAHDKDGNPWDIMDSVTNPGDQGAVFVPTKVLVTRGQVQEGYCESKLHPCSAPADCDIGDEALQKPECSNGFCVRRQWCPAQSEGAPETTTHYVDTGGYDVWFQTNLHYHKFMLDVSTTDEPEPRKYPQDHPNTFPVHDLLRMANIEPDSIKDNGAVITVNNIFSCDLNEHVCDRSLEANNIDTTTGFNYVQNHFYMDGGVRKRDTFRYYGIRIVAFATGLGKKTSFANIVLQVSSAIALLSVAQTAADVFLQYIVPERRHYVDMKVIPTEDFNE
jgi:hypothetical protein